MKPVILLAEAGEDLENAWEFYERQQQNVKPGRVRHVVVGIALLTVALIAWRSGPQEPVHHGKTLTQWINEANDVGIFEQRDETKDAMLAFGTNAVPFLLKEFTRPISPWRDRLFAWVNSHSPLRIYLRTDEARVRVAGRGLMLLETNAAPALPVLARYTDDPVRDGFVIEILCSVGEAALPDVTAQLASTNAVVITNVLLALQRMAYRSDPAREAFTAALNHPSTSVRAAAEGLGERQADGRVSPAPP